MSEFFQWAYVYDLYDVLGVASSDMPADDVARTAVLQKAYRRRALVYHPDRGGNENDFKLLNAAVAILSDMQEFSAWWQWRRSQFQAQLPPRAEPFDVDEPPLVEADYTWEDRSAWANFVDECINGLQAWLPVVPHSHPMRAMVSERKSHLAGLRFIGSTANFFAPVLANWANACLSVAGQPWKDAMKPLSMQGYDVVNNRKVDYGNFQYRVVTHMWGLRSRSIYDSLVRAAGAFAALHPHRPDTPRVLDRQGDVVEILMAACRGDESYGLRAGYSAVQWTIAYNELIMLCRAVDFLYASLHGLGQKISPWISRTPRIQFLDERQIFCMTNSSAAFAFIASTFATNFIV